MGLTARATWIGPLLEGIALEQALVTGLIEDATGVSVNAFNAIGAGRPATCGARFLADATGKSIQRSRTVEASSLGAAISAPR